MLKNVGYAIRRFAQHHLDPRRKRRPSSLGLDPPKNGLAAEGKDPVLKQTGERKSSAESSAKRRSCRSNRGSLSEFEAACKRELDAEERTYRALKKMLDLLANE